MKFLKGLSRDTNPVDQPAGTWRYAKNIVVPPNSGTIQSERGTGHIDFLTTGHQVVGTVILPDERVCIFSVHETTGDSEIGRFDPVTSIYTPLYNDSTGTVINKLKFKLQYPIQGTPKMDITGKMSVYWTDDNEAMRYVQLYNVPTIPHDIEDFNIFPQLSSSPHVSLNSISNGTLETGAYALTVAFIDDEGTPTNYISISRWVYIVPSASNESASRGALGPVNDGGAKGYTVSALSSHVKMAYMGGESAGPSGKGIIFDVTGLDPRYSFLRPALISKQNGILTVVRLQDIDYDATASTSMKVSVDGYGDTIAETIENVLIPRDTYTKAKTVAQVDDTLYWGNMEKNSIDLGYQPYAMNIEISAVQANPGFSSSPVDINGTDVNFNMNTPSPTNALRSASDIYHYQGYQRDDVYAFYISWVTLDGNESVAYHIPGRAALPLDAIAGAGLTEKSLASACVNDLPFMDPGNGSISQEAHIGSAVSQIGDYTTVGATLGSSKGMGYHENKTEVYPANSNYTALDENGVVGYDYATGTEPVRHHHFPSSCQGEGGGHIYGGGGHAGNKTINPMCIKVKHVPLPSFMLGKVLGYRIYYAKRTEGNSLVVDTGILNSMPSANRSRSSSSWGANDDNGWSNAYIWQINGKNTHGPSAQVRNCDSGASGWQCTNLVRDYAIQAPPGGVDYDAYTGNITGGDLVAYPGSCAHAPYSDADDGATSGFYFSHDRRDWTPRANHFSFNGLHLRVNDPDVSNVQFLKVHKHMRIGRKDSTNMQLGFYIIRYDKSGAKITSLNGGNTDRLYTMFDWTQMGSVDYDNNKTEGTLYNTGTVGAGSWAPSFRAVGEAMNIPAGNNINSGASPAGTIRNDGGCQTTYLYTYNDIYTHDMSTTLMIYYAYSMYGSILTNKQAFQSTASSHLFNYPYLHPGMHSSLINLYDQTGYGAGTWAFKHLSIQYGRLNNVFNATIDGDNNWENGWTIGFHSYICNNATPYAVIAPNMDMQRGNGGYYFNDYWWSATDDKVIQYMAYGSLHRVISDPYYPFDLQQDLVFTGYEYDVTGISVPTDIMDNTKIFGGDIFIDYYMETRSMTATTFTYGWPGPMPIQCTISTSGTCCYSDDHYYDSDSTHRSVHYVYGLMGDIHSPDNVHTDTTQQLYITESKVNIHMRYTENNDNEDYYPAVDFDSQEINKWKPGARLFTFNQDYNSVMNIRPVVAFNHLNKVSVLSDFPTRIIRSESNNRSGLKDNFRIYKSSQYRDLPRQRGELWNLAIYDNVLLPQTERTLMKTKGKESLETGGGAGDVTAIALGDGDVFKHDPSEILYTERGYAGSTDQYSVTVSRYGHLSVDRQAGKVFLLGEKLEEISALGMREFLYKRITNWGLEPYGMPRNLDIPPAGIGIITAWDNQIERYLVTKLDKSPTAEFITAYDNGDIIFNLGSRQFEHDGDLIAWDDVEYFNDYSWTISYYPGLKFWASIHDYSPRLYFYTSDLLFSMSVDGTGSTTNAIYVHNYEGTGGTHFNVSQFYGVDYDVVFEYITNIEPESNKLYSNFYYTVDVEIPSLNEEGIRREVQETGFDVFYVYNSRQASRETPLIAPGGQYNLVQTTANTRRKQRTWYVNAFRDDVAQQVAGSGTLDVHPTSNILSSNLLSADINMNIGAINTTKVWDQRRKFTDKWFAIRLIMNSANNASATGKFLVTLHSADATYRPVYR